MISPDGVDSTLTGGEPLLHPEIADIIGHLAEKGAVSVLTSGFALSRRNPNRVELLDRLKDLDASYEVASPDEHYHSITKDDVAEIKHFIRAQGLKPKKFGYGSTSVNWHKALFALTGIGIPLLLIGYLIDKYASGPPQVFPVGRAQNLPEDQLMRERRYCSPFKGGIIHISYKGDLQYCIYSCHDGFMNISELRGINDKEEAIGFVRDRLMQDERLKRMADEQVCLFDIAAN